MSQTYRKAGVDIDAGEEVVRRIKSTVRATFTKNVLTDIGAFGAFYRASFPRMKEPVLVSSVDGVGTKLKVAFAMKRYDTVGQDLVNHCVNDIGVCGAVPLYFLDYFATGKLAPSVAVQVIGGFAKACRENGCSIIGGETAEMPGLYANGEFDLAGTIVGVVEKKKIIDGKKIANGDVLIGLPSTGLHTNGYSLARHVLLKKFSLKKRIPELQTTLGDALLTVHRSYLRPITALTSNGLVKGMSHITGGGIVGNTMRVIPKGLRLDIAWDMWDRPPLFSLIQAAGKVPEPDMRRTFNLGIGLIVIVSPEKCSVSCALLRSIGEIPMIIGEVT
ncbi:MAG: phosphoribosylformylglycinamidine cyclo-ligase [Ignavibacteriales bacterium]|nr:phosphoribosylformylglycinamidine cyclo-ligase [Ignavibacteriales bacterium]